MEGNIDQARAWSVSEGRQPSARTLMMGPNGPEILVSGANSCGETV